MGCVSSSKAVDKPQPATQPKATQTEELAEQTEDLVVDSKEPDDTLDAAATAGEAAPAAVEPEIELQAQEPVEERSPPPRRGTSNLSNLGRGFAERAAPKVAAAGGSAAPAPRPCSTEHLWRDRDGDVAHEFWVERGGRLKLVPQDELAKILPK
eukprot:NODE_14078_length_1130_cov_2.658026.p1 GENE.NODE_14078_length_1130_cov_2.658026~~NODE_14078_length_1130_cov_2.658026.p1  ORF type:complete len:154 (+),score=46.23 NODE_14078_length_1130_cov_2.658026:203-664(+)